MPLVLFTASLWMISTTLVNATLSKGDKKEILGAHNYFRGQVDPIAINMQRLVSVLVLLFRILVHVSFHR